MTKSSGNMIEYLHT